MTQKKLDISVILPVYKNDCVEYFSSALNSILSQTLKPAEIIIVIDGPIPNDLESFIESHANQGTVRKLRLAQNRGLAHALNAGITASKYPLIARMDSDDISLPNRFELQAAHLANNELDLVGGQIFEFGRDIYDIKSERIVPVEHEEIVRFMKLRSPFSHPTVLFRKALFETVGGYSEEFIMEDYEFFVRCHLHNAKFGNIKEKILYYRVGQNYEVLKRRIGLTYAKSELALYNRFYKSGYFQAKDIINASIYKLPLRLLPFPIFRYIYQRLRK